MIIAREVQVELFCKWAETFAEEEKDRSGAFNGWLAMGPERRAKCLAGLVNGEFTGFGDGPQLETVMLASLFHVLTFGRCIVATPMRLDAPLLRKISRAIEEILDEPVRGVGSELTCMPTALKFSNVVKSPLVLADFFVFSCELSMHPQYFPSGLPVLFLEIDTCLYKNRLMFFDRGRPQTTGMVYRCSKDIIPQWRGSPNIFDVLEGMRQLKIEAGGSFSYMEGGTAAEFQSQAGKILGRKPAPNLRQKYTAFTYRTSDERCAALIGDVLKCPSDAFVFFGDDELGKKLSRELRRSGQDFVLAKNTEDMVTALQTVSGRHVVLQPFSVSTMYPRGEGELKPGRIFIAELFMDESSMAKIVAAVSRAAIIESPPVVYFSSDDKLMSIYGEQGGFERFYSIMDFTEKYDPWRQIRRVFSKLIISRLDNIRSACLDDNMPIGSTSISGQQAGIAAGPGGRGATMTAARMTEGLCFCGSGKPFKECHGRAKAK